MTISYSIEIIMPYVKISLLLEIKVYSTTKY